MDGQSLRSKLVVRDLSQSLGKLPPQATDLEETVIGMVLLERQACIVALEKLTPEDFYLDAHAEIFTAISQLAQNGNPVNMRSVVHQLRTNGKDEIIGGPYVIAELVAKVSSAASIEYYCSILIEKRILRDMIQLASEIHYKAYDHDADPFVLMETISAFPSKIFETIKTGRERLIKEGIINLANHINKRGTEPVKSINGIPTGFPALDRLLDGYKGGNFIIKAARPSMGKTTEAINEMRNQAVMFKLPVGFFSLEMTYDELVTKLVSAETDIELRKLTKEILTPVDYDRFLNNTKQLINAPIYIDDTPGLTSEEFRVKARAMVERYGVKIIYIDYLQLMRGPSELRRNRELEISHISRTIKLVAKELNIPIIALSQLSREVEKRPLPKMPILADLRESGSLEQDTDIVMFLWRPNYYKVTGDEGGTFIDGITKVIIAKYRNGSLGETFLQLIGKASKFIEVESPYEHEQKAQTPESVQQEQPKPKTDDDLPF